MILLGKQKEELNDKCLLQEDMQLVSKSMDCLRILTTGNEANKKAIYQIGGTPQDSLQRRGPSTRSSNLSAIMQHMRPDGDPVCVPSSHLISTLEHVVCCIGVHLHAGKLAPKRWNCAA